MRLTRGSTIDGYSGFNKISLRDKYSIYRPLVFYTKDEMQFLPSDNCSGAIKPDFICNGDSVNPIDIDYNDEYFLSASFGINSQNPIRLELSYFKLGKEIDVLGTNKVGLEYINKLDKDIKKNIFSTPNNTINDDAKKHLELELSASKLFNIINESNDMIEYQLPLRKD